LHAFGRAARAHAAWSARAARYRLRPPFAATSRLTVEGALPNPDAIARIDRPTARGRSPPDPPSSTGPVAAAAAPV
jgi:hypothetical protein